MTLGATLPDAAPALSPEELSRFQSEPDVPRLAVEAVCRALPAAGDDATLRAAVRGATEAARSWEAELGVTFRQWALFHAVERAFEHQRRACTGDRPLLARMRAAMTEFLASHREVLDPFQDSRDRNIGRLRAFSDGLLASAAGRMAFGAQALSAGEDDVVEVEAARRTGEALSAAIAELDPADAELLRLCFAEGRSVRAVARETGKSYGPLLERHHEILARLRARLRGRGMQPVWIDGVSREVFAQGAANDAARAETETEGER